MQEDNIQEFESIGEKLIRNASNMLEEIRNLQSEAATLRTICDSMLRTKALYTAATDTNSHTTLAFENVDEAAVFVTFFNYKIEVLENRAQRLIYKLGNINEFIYEANNGNAETQSLAS